MRCCTRESRRCTSIRSGCASNRGCHLLNLTVEHQQWLKILGSPEDDSTTEYSKKCRRQCGISNGSCGPSMDRQQALHLATGEDLSQKPHVWICGLTGVGTSHLVQALAHEDRQQGFEVLVVNTGKMLQHLHGGRKLPQGNPSRRGWLSWHTTRQA
jgi:hypothetical protein